MSSNQHSEGKNLTKKEALLKASRYCAYQERSHKQVRDKLFSYGLFEEEVEELISKLITAGFINEERFAKTFIRGKFKFKKWGRLKIQQALQIHQISDYCLREGFKEINEEEYRETLKDLAEKKLLSVSGKDLYEKKWKTQQFLAHKGYEFDLINDVLSELSTPQ